jgi:FMN phosphatase YigB (HAD superfamily)
MAGMKEHKADTAPPVQALIFDLGNVLVRYDGAKLRANLAALAPDGVSAADVDRFLHESGAAWQAEIGELDEAGLYEACRRGLGIAADAAAFCVAWNDVFAPQPGIEVLLAELAGRLPLIVLSNINPLHAAHLRATLPLLARCDALLFSCETGAAKPAPEAYRRAVVAAGVPAAACLFVDDLAENVEGARRCGLQALQFTTVPDLRAALRWLRAL